MDDKNPTPEGIKPDKSAGRRKRTAPTIDLEAKEIPSNSTGPLPTEPVQEPVAEAAMSQPEPPPVSEIQSDHIAEPAPEPETADVAQEPPKPKAVNPSPARFWLVGGLAGAAAAAIIVGIAMVSGVFTRGDVAQTTPDPRIATLEAQLKQLQNRPAPVATAPATTANDTLTPRLAKIEDQLAKLASPSANDSALASLGVALAALNKRYDELSATTRDAQTRAEAAEKAAAELRGNLQDVSKTAQAGPSSADVTSLQQRLTALEDQSKKARADLTKATESDKAARLALSATAVRDAALRGVPFAEELAQAKTLGASEAALAPLWPFAASGVPNTKALAKELSDLLPQIRKAATPATSANAGFMERLAANAEGLVRVRPTGSVAGDDATAVLARLESNLAREDINAALTDVGALPQSARQIASDWVTRAMARQKALIAARDFAADSARSLASK